MNSGKIELTTHEHIRYLCDILHQNMPLADSSRLLLIELNKKLKATISNWYWFNEQMRSFILFSSSSDVLSSYGENQLRLNDFFTGRMLRNNFEPYQFYSSKRGIFKLFLNQPLLIHETLAGCILVQSISSHQDYDYEQFYLSQLIMTLNVELPGILQLDNQLIQNSYSIINELSFIFDQVSDIRHFSKLVVRNACLIFDAQSSILSLFNPTMDCFEILDSFTILSREALSYLIEFDNSVAMKTTSASSLFRKENLLIEKFEQFGSPAITVISICLRSRNMILGALSLYGKKQTNLYNERDFTLADQELFMHFSDLVSSKLNQFFLT